MNSPKPKPMAPPAKVIELYQEMRGAMVKAEVLLMQVLRHPTATDERVAEAVRSYRTSYAGFRAVRNSLRKHFGQARSAYESWNSAKAVYPWNRD